MNRTKAYKIVLNDLIQLNLFKGIYDAKNGNETFMRGIATVMENIAYRISKKDYEDFCEMFESNIIKSKEKENKDGNITRTISRS